MTLHIARGFDLPDSAVTETFAILARRGAGKTYTAKVFAEELIKAGYPVVILDPVGVWQGLRSNAAGTGAGYPVTILGGEHGDLPLDAHAGVLVANLVASDPVAVVLDLSSFDSKNQHRQFVTDFAERLYRAKAQQSERTPLHLIIDEADEFAPQSRADKGDMRMLGAFETLVRRGRARGIGVTMITQRPAVLNKNVLTQIECLIVMQITSPQDRDAIGEWVKGNASKEEQRIVEASLASLQQGEAWIWSPAWLQTLERVKIRKALTFDSSATPKPGEERREAKVLAPVDLDRLKEGMDRVVRDAEANDPRRLQARIRELEAELKKRPTETVIETIEERVEVPVVDQATLERLDELLQPHAALLSEVQELLAEHRTGRYDRPTPAGTAPQPPTPRPPRAEPFPSTSSVTIGRGDGAARMLAALAQFPAGLSRAQLATLAKMKKTGGSFGTYLSRLRTAGLATVDGNTITITAAGLEHAGATNLAALTGDELIDTWRERLSGGARRMFDLLVDAWPNPIDSDTLAEHANITKTGGTFGTYLSRLRTNGLITVDGADVCASETLFLPSGSGR